MIGISKQAVNQYNKRQVTFDHLSMELVADAEMLRRAHPGCGVEKMYSTLRPTFIGRDRFIDMMMEAGFRLRRPKNYRRTTFSGEIHYPNLIKGMEVYAPNTIWQSDITYIQLGERFYYGVFIIDVYTKKIVGYKLSSHMRASANLAALADALKNNPAPQIHHSDRGSQYGHKGYIDLLKTGNTKVSMGLKAQDNAYAERINRTIKEEYLAHWKANCFTALKKNVDNAVKHYNNNRQHNHLAKMTPTDFEKQWNTWPKHRRPRITIFDENNI